MISSLWRRAQVALLAASLCSRSTFSVLLTGVFVIWSTESAALVKPLSLPLSPPHPVLSSAQIQLPGLKRRKEIQRNKNSFSFYGEEEEEDSERLWEGAEGSVDAHKSGPWWKFPFQLGRTEQRERRRRRSRRGEKNKTTKNKNPHTLSSKLQTLTHSNARRNIYEVQSHENEDNGRLFCNS